jgi:3'-5' exoribonuclease
VTEDYQGSRQLRILEMIPTGEEEIDFRQLIPASSRSTQELEEELDMRLAELQDIQLGNLLREWFEEPTFRELFATAPAAKQIHHARLGGLLEHSLEVVTLGLVMARLYGANQAMVTAGALLHDVGKIYEYSWFPVLDLTDQGRLLGHITIGYQLLQERGKYLNGEKLLHLGHIILSHHGEIEYGSPVRPQTLEAMIVHEADLASGRLRAAADALDQGEELWTSWQKGLSRSLFRGFR